ncbi:MAG: LamG domain-containing protein [Nannocystaceae bacterium]|nr:LamG domain-containing protein [Nannocystaceae bacterium]
MKRFGVVLSFVGLGCTFETGGGAPASGMTVGDTGTPSGAGSTGPGGTSGPTDPSDATNSSGPTNPTDPTLGPSGTTEPSGTTNPTTDPTTDPSTTDESTTLDPSTTAAEDTGGTTGDTSSTGGSSFELCDDSLAALRACYDFAGADSGTLSDGSMNNNGGTTAGVVLEPGPFGEALRGSEDSVVSVMDDETLDITGDLTFEAWVWLDSLPGAGRIGILDNDGQYSLMVYEGAGLRCSVGGGAVFSGVVATEEWFHVACVYDGSDLSLWVDGVMLDSVGSGSAGSSNNQPMSLADTSPGFQQPMDGLLGGVRVWSEARSAEELGEAAAVLR